MNNYLANGLLITNSFEKAKSQYLLCGVIIRADLDWTCLMFWVFFYYFQLYEMFRIACLEILIFIKFLHPKRHDYSSFCLPRSLFWFYTFYVFL